MAGQEQHMNPTLLGCPDCSGVLSVEKEGAEGHLRYTCHVGHRFSLNSLVEAKENQLEEAFWSVVSLLQHIGMICTEVKNHSDSTDLRSRTQARIKQVQEHEKAIRVLIEETDPPILEPRDDAGCIR